MKRDEDLFWFLGSGLSKSTPRIQPETHKLPTIFEQFPTSFFRLCRDEAFRGVAQNRVLSNYLKYTCCPLFYKKRGVRNFLQILGWCETYWLRKPLIGLVDLADFCKIWVFQILVSNVIYCDYHFFQFTYIYWNSVLITSHTQLSKQLPVISRHFFVVSLGIFFTATPQAAVYGLLCPFLPELHGNGVHGGNLGGVGWGMQQDVKKRVRMLTKDTRKRWLDGFFGRFFFWLYPPWH